MARPRPIAAVERLAPGNGAVALNVETGGYFQLNELGTVIWETMGSGQKVSDIVDAIRDSLREDVPTLEEDIIQFLGSLAERDLISVEGPDGDDHRPGAP